MPVSPPAAGTHPTPANGGEKWLPVKPASLDKRSLPAESPAGGVAGAPAVAGTCPVNAVTYSAPAAAAPMPGLAVTVDNGSTGRLALVDVSANLGVDPDAEVRLAYSVDGAAPQENAFGPANPAHPHQGWAG